MKNRYGVLTKSNRAIEAEERGLVTFSKLLAWQKQAVRAGFVFPSEWHHTSGAANKTYYYDLEAFDELNAEDFKPEKVEKAKQPDLSKVKIKIVYDKMVGGFTRGARKKFEEIEVEGLDVRQKDNVITGAGGRRLSSHNSLVKFFYQTDTNSDWQEVSYNYLSKLGYKFISFY